MNSTHEENPNIAKSNESESIIELPRPIKATAGTVVAAATRASIISQITRPTYT